MAGLGYHSHSCKLARAQLMVLFAFMSLNYKYIAGAVIGEVQLLKFENKDNTREDGIRCDLTGSSECDTIFHINISNSVGSSCITGKCLYNGKSTKQIENRQGIVDFLSDDTGLPRPIVVRWLDWDGGFQLALEAIDVDYLTGNDRVDSHAITVKPSLQANKSVAIARTYSSQGTRNAKKTLLTFQVKVYCAPNHYGSMCTIYCNSNLAPHKYTCNEDGSKQCLTGWYGTSCNTFCLPTKGDHYTCDNKGQKVCYTGWSGDQCDKPTATLTSVLSETTAVLPSSPCNVKSLFPIASSSYEGYSVAHSTSVLPTTLAIPTSLGLTYSSGLFGQVATTSLSTGALHTNERQTEWISPATSAIPLQSRKPAGVTPSISWQPTITQTIGNSETSTVQFSSLLLGSQTIPIDKATPILHPSASSTSAKLSSSSNSEVHSKLVKGFSFTISSLKLSKTALQSLVHSVLLPNYNRTTSLAVLALASGTEAYISTSTQQATNRTHGISKGSSSTNRIYISSNIEQIAPTTKVLTIVTLSVSRVNDTSAGPEVRESRGLTIDSEIMQGTVSGVGLLILLIIATLVYCKCRSHRKGTQQRAPVKTLESTKFVRFQENQKNVDGLSKEGMEMHCQSNPVYFAGANMLNGSSQVSCYGQNVPHGDFDYCTVPAKSVLKRKENANDCEVTSVHSFVNHSYANLA